MINKIFLIILCTFTLVACDKIDQKLTNTLEESAPQTSSEQDVASNQLYEALLKKDKAEVIRLVDPKIKGDVDQNIIQIFESLDNVRSEKLVKPSIVGIKKTINTEVGKVLEVVYSYQYGKGDIYLTVIFKGHEGGTNILGFWLINNVE